MAGRQSIAESLTAEQWDELTEAVLRALERRAAEEQARRGRRIDMRAM